MSAIYKYRFLARFIIEAKTPLKVGSGDKSILTDALVATDVNGLPYIPGTAIAGILRHLLRENGYFDIDKIFGSEDKKNGHGSEIIFTDAKILNSQGDVTDGLNFDFENDDLLRHFKNELPIRQHVKINDKGVTDKSGKFDEQVVFSGTRFCFEIEMLSDDNDKWDDFVEILDLVKSKIFRIGGGTRKGFGEIEVVDLKTRSLNLETQSDLQIYLQKSSNLSDKWNGWVDYSDTKPNEDVNAHYIEYRLELSPEDFFLFGSGFSDKDADMTPVTERKVVWNDKGELSNELVLIPATSIKGAISHRTAFHYNKIKKYFVGNENVKKEKDNEAVKVLFGYENQEAKEQKRGNVIFSDLIQEEKFEDKILNHVAIDRFTGGAIDGALFQEKTIYGKNHPITLNILVNNTQIEKDVIDAFEAALKDVCSGMLPLGGGVNRGNGIFGGTLYKNNQEIYPKKEE